MKKNFLISLILVLVLCFSVVGCNKTPEKDPVKPDPEKPVDTTTLSLDKTSLSIGISESAKVNVTTNYEGNLVFSSSNPGVAFVRGAGKTANVTGKKVGKADLIVKAGTKEVKCAITVSQSDSISLDKNILTIDDGGDMPHTLTATFTSKISGKTPVFTSSNTDLIAIASQDDGVCVLQGKKVGKAEITATMGTEVTSAVVEVTNKEIVWSMFANQQYLQAEKLKDGTTITGEVYIPNIAYLNGSIFPVGVVNIDCFKGIKTITSAYIGNQVILLHNGCFDDSGLTSIRFASDSILRNVHKWSFRNTQITEFIWPNGADGTYLGREAFYGCSKLKKVQLPDTLPDIIEKAFYNCEALDEIYIPAVIMSIESQSFGSDAGKEMPLTKVYYGGASAQWDELVTNKPAGVNWGKLDSVQKKDIFFGATALGTGAKPAV